MTRKCNWNVIYACSLWRDLELLSLEDLSLQLIGLFERLSKVRRKEIEHGL